MRSYQRLQKNRISPTFIRPIQHGDRIILNIVVVNIIVSAVNAKLNLIMIIDLPFIVHFQSEAF